MSDLIVTKNQPRLPRAIAKEKDGITLYWVEELGIAGLHIRGVEALLQTETATVRNVIASLQGAQTIRLLEVEVLTGGGIQGAQLVVESDLPKVLRSIERSKAKEETRDRAGDIRDRLAAAGFKLMVMLELAPQRLQAQIDAYVRPKTALELAREQVKLLEQIELQEAQIKLLEADNLRQSEAIDELFEYSSIIRIAKFNECDEKAFAWHKLKAASTALNEEIKKVPCPRFGTKNLYSHNAWRFAYPGYKLPETTTLVIANHAAHNTNCN